MNFLRTSFISAVVLFSIVNVPLSVEAACPNCKESGSGQGCQNSNPGLLGVGLGLPILGNAPGSESQCRSSSCTSGSRSAGPGPIQGPSPSPSCAPGSRPVGPGPIQGPSPSPSCASGSRPVGPGPIQGPSPSGPSCSVPGRVPSPSGPAPSRGPSPSGPSSPAGPSRGPSPVGPAPGPYKCPPGYYCFCQPTRCDYSIDDILSLIVGKCGNNSDVNQCMSAICDDNIRCTCDPGLLRIIVFLVLNLRYLVSIIVQVSVEVTANVQLGLLLSLMLSLDLDVCLKVILNILTGKTLLDIALDLGLNLGLDVDLGLDLGVGLGLGNGNGLLGSDNGLGILGNGANGQGLLGLDVL